MSFKRDGNDNSCLHHLRKRRISEIYAENIPKNEVLLMKNGRLACMVCPHRPTFDTLQIMHLHRRGKKHFEGSPNECTYPNWNEANYYEKKRKKFSIGKKYDDRKHKVNEEKKTNVKLKTGEEYLKQLFREADDLSTNNNTMSTLMKVKAYSPKIKHYDVEMKPHHTTICKNPFQSHNSPFFSLNKDKKEEIKDDKTTIKSYHVASATRLTGTSIKSSMHEYSQTPIVTQATASPNTNNGKHNQVHRFSTCQKSLYLKAIQDGWLRRADGGWRKDGDVEFDSDDQEPPNI